MSKNSFKCGQMKTEINDMICLLVKCAREIKKNDPASDLAKEVAFFLWENRLYGTHNISDNRGYIDERVDPCCNTLPTMSQ